MREKRRLIIVSVFSIFLVSILLIGSTYSVFTTRDIDENLNVYKTGNLDITYTVSEDNIQFTNSAPMSEEAANDVTPYRITITNNGTVPYQFDVILEDTTASNAIDYQYIMTKVGRLEAKTLESCTDNVVKEDVVILPNSSVDIDVRVWVSDQISNTEMGNSFFAKLKIDGIAVYNDNKEIDNSILKDYEKINKVITANAILDNQDSTYVTSSTGIDFSTISSDTNGKGVYILSSTKDDTYPIYYYRGAVDNNNLIFAETCWKMVRTTETGGLKLIYNGVPSNGQCNNSGSSSQIGTKEFNSSYNSPSYVGYMYANPYTSSSKSSSDISSSYYYGNDVTYSGGTYTLTDTITGSSWSSLYNGGLNNNHYTCFSTGTTCSTVYYIYYSISSTAYYISLTGGKKVEDALREMLGADDGNTTSYNTTSSTIKGNSTTSGTLDYWYYTNIVQKGYGGYVEDTVWCNDRSIFQKNGWDPNGGNTTKYLYFSAYDRAYNTYSPSVVCSREIDRFTVDEANGNGDLDYPVGLLTVDEMMLAGGTVSENSSYYLYTGESYWLGAPAFFRNASALEFDVGSSGDRNCAFVNLTLGVRPSISLKPGVTISDGNGEASNPYIVG